MYVNVIIITWITVDTTIVRGSFVLMGQVCDDLLYGVRGW